MCEASWKKRNIHTFLFGHCDVSPLLHPKTWFCFVYPLWSNKHLSLFSIFWWMFRLTCQTWRLIACPCLIKAYIVQGHDTKKNKKITAGNMGASSRKFRIKLFKTSKYLQGKELPAKQPPEQTVASTTEWCSPALSPPWLVRPSLWNNVCKCQKFSKDDNIDILQFEDKPVYFSAEKNIITI